MGNEYTEAERLMNLETRTENIEKLLTRMDKKMDSWQTSFVSKELLDEKLKARDREIERLDKEFIRLDTEKASHKNNLPLWVAAIASAAALIVSMWPHVK
jgi:predicted RNase H-like nuclease (RuvC/YqgF family)